MLKTNHAVENNNCTKGGFQRGSESWVQRWCKCIACDEVELQWLSCVIGKIPFWNAFWLLWSFWLPLNGGIKLFYKLAGLEVFINIHTKAWRKWAIYFTVHALLKGSSKCSLDNSGFSASLRQKCCFQKGSLLTLLEVCDLQHHCLKGLK